jgi:hypothetical protein
MEEVLDVYKIPYDSQWLSENLFALSQRDQAASLR